MKKEKEKKKKREKRAQSEPDVLQEPSAAEEAPRRELPEQAQLARFSAVAGGKWKLRILWALREGKARRYGEIKAEVEGITDMMLSQSLRELAADALVQRRQFQEIPPKVEYKLTEIVLPLVPVLQQLGAWAAQLPAPEEKE